MLTIPSLSEATAAANRIISIRPTKAELADKRKEMPPGEGAVSIEFKDVDFTYPDRNVKVLNKLNIKVCAKNRRKENVDEFRSSQDNMQRSSVLRVSRDAIDPF
jgi:ABC-type multidrug transport system fused ATPase/permease subunit